ncbi:MAG: hypothetical protein ACR2NN_09580 [Bryobacteraceae bacterium]
MLKIVEKEISRGCDSTTAPLRGTHHGGMKNRFAVAFFGGPAESDLSQVIDMTGMFYIDLS